MARDGVARTLVDIFTAPTEAFGILRDKPRVLFPLALLLVCYVGLTFVYMRSVDIPWLLENNIQSAAARMSPDQRQQAIDRISKISPTVVTVSAVVSSCLALLVLLFLAAGYLALVSLLTNDGYKLSRWFSLVCWCSLPLIVALLASLVNVLVGDASHLAPEKLNPLSFGNLFELTGPPRGFADRMLRRIDPTSVWSMALLVFGYQAWTGKALGKAAGIVLAPLAVLLALVLLFALR